MRKINIFFRMLYILCFILAITAIWGLFYSTNERNIILHDTVLLNPKNAPLVNIITIRADSPQNVLEISKIQNDYIGNYHGIIFPINKSKVIELVNKASTSVPVQLISDNINDMDIYEVSGNIPPSRELTFLGYHDSSIEEYSKLFFGTSDFTGAMRYVRSSLSTTIYSLRDEYYTFLQPTPSAWVDPKIIPDMLKKNNPDSNIASLSLISNDYELILYSGDTNFDEKIQTVLSVQTANVVEAKRYLGESPIATVLVHYFNNYEISCNIYKTETESYVVVPESEQLLYGLDISLWSFERLLNTFID